VVHNDRNDFPLDPVIIAHFIMVEHLPLHPRYCCSSYDLPFFSSLF
jgi:hypothetical protein